MPVSQDDKALLLHPWLWKGPRDGIRAHHRTWGVPVCMPFILKQPLCRSEAGPSLMPCLGRKLLIKQQVHSACGQPTTHCTIDITVKTGPSEANPQVRKAAPTWKDSFAGFLENGQAQAGSEVSKFKTMFPD